MLYTIYCGMNKQELKILSYNIWFDEYERSNRLSSLFQVITNENPDIVCLQEILSTQYDEIKENISYKYAFPDKINNGYGCAIFSKFPIVKSKALKLPSNMNRMLLLVQIGQVIVANVHFESEFNNICNNTKLQQYHYVSTLLTKLYNTYNNVIMCADTNLMKVDECTYNKYFEHFTDAWSIMKVKYHEYTYDFLTNKHLQMRNLKFRSRIDRMLFKGKHTLELVNFKLLTCKNYKIQPSDHHGIMSTFSVTYVDDLIV